jgi:hypothetical protein
MTYYCIQMINNSQFAHFLNSYKKAYIRYKILTKKFGIDVYLLDVYGQTLLRVLFINWVRRELFAVYYWEVRSSV